MILTQTTSILTILLDGLNPLSRYWSLYHPHWALGHYNGNRSIDLWYEPAHWDLKPTPTDTDRFLLKIVCLRDVDNKPIFFIVVDWFSNIGDAINLIEEVHINLNGYDGSGTKMTEIKIECTADKTKLIQHPMRCHRYNHVFNNIIIPCQGYLTISTTIRAISKTRTPTTTTAMFTFSLVDNGLNFIPKAVDGNVNIPLPHWILSISEPQSSHPTPVIQPPNNSAQQIWLIIPLQIWCRYNFKCFWKGQ